MEVRHLAAQCAAASGGVSGYRDIGRRMRRLYRDFAAGKAIVRGETPHLQTTQPTLPAGGS